MKVETRLTIVVRLVVRFTGGRTIDRTVGLVSANKVYLSRGTSCKESNVISPLPLHKKWGPPKLSFAYDSNNFSFKHDYWLARPRVVEGGFSLAHLNSHLNPKRKPSKSMVERIIFLPTMADYKMLLPPDPLKAQKHP